jgi:hypothetical protein
MKTRFVVTGFIFFHFFLSCKSQQYKPCICLSKNEQIRVYSEVLNELVENRFYDLYLGKDANTVFELKIDNHDSAELIKKTVALQNEIFDSPERSCTLYLDTFLVPKFNPWYLIKKSSNELDVTIKDLINEFSLNGQDVVDSINTIQGKYGAEDYTLCTSKVRSMKKFIKSDTGCFIGRIALSKLYFNQTHTQVLLFYQFVCGGMCGKSELLVIQNTNGKWRIKKSILLSIR